MSQGYSKKVILYAAGTSGNFLGNFLVVNSVNLPSPRFRVDWKQPSSSSLVMAFGSESSIDYRLVDYDTPETLNNIKNLINNDNRQVIISHYSKVSALEEFLDYCWIKKIYPKSNVFGWIKNAYYKKTTLEFVDYTRGPWSYKVDQAIMHLNTWYSKHKLDTDLPDHMLIDFGNLYNIDYLAELFEQANGIPPEKAKIKWAQEYIDQQLPPINDSNSLDLTEIFKKINPADFFDVAIALFIYERNHKTLDQNRLWSIDDLPNNLNDAVDFLKKNQKNYTIFYA